MKAMERQYAFSIDEAVLIKYGLKKGMELDELLLTEIHYEDDIRKTYHLALNYLAKRMRSEGEVRKYLLEKEVDPPIIQEVILKLYNFKFLNDEEYALSYVRTQMNTTDKGSILIKRELAERGISTNLIEKAIKQYPFEMELETAIKNGRKMISRNNKDSGKVIKNKLEQLLVRKGFNFEMINEAIMVVMKENSKDERVALQYQAQKLHGKYANEVEAVYRQKMKQALFRKGFSIEQIENYLNNEE